MQRLIFFKESENAMSTVARKDETVLFTLNTAMVNGSRVYRATATIPGFGPATVRKAEGDANFPNRSAAMKACKRRAEALGYAPRFKTLSITTTRPTSKRRCSKV